MNSVKRCSCSARKSEPARERAIRLFVEKPFVEKPFVDNLFVDNLFVDNLFVDNLFVDNLLVDNREVAAGLLDDFDRFCETVFKAAIAKVPGDSSLFTDKELAYLVG